MDFMLVKQESYSLTVGKSCCGFTEGGDSNFSNQSLKKSSSMSPKAKLFWQIATVETNENMTVNAKAFILDFKTIHSRASNKHT